MPRLKTTIKPEMAVQMNLEAHERECAVRYQAVQDKLDSLDKTLEAQEKELKLSKKTFTLTRRRYGAGTSTQKDLNDAELRLSLARIKKQTSLYQLAEIKLNIEHLVAKK